MNATIHLSAEDIKRAIKEHVEREHPMVIVQSSVLGPLVADIDESGITANVAVQFKPAGNPQR